MWGVLSAEYPIYLSPLTRGVSASTEYPRGILTCSTRTGPFLDSPTSIGGGMQKAMHRGSARQSKHTRAHTHAHARTRARGGAAPAAAAGRASAPAPVAPSPTHAAAARVYAPEELCRLQLVQALSNAVCARAPSAFAEKARRRREKASRLRRDASSLPLRILPSSSPPPFLFASSLPARGPR